MKKFTTTLFQNKSFSDCNFFLKSQSFPKNYSTTVQHQAPKFSPFNTQRVPLTNNAFLHTTSFFATHSKIPPLDVVFENNDKWIAEKLKVDPNYFKELGKGQSPEILYIGCSDSRVTAEELMGVGPGEVFVHRNIANMVINTDLSCQSVINFAIDHLKVNQVVVCGHTSCGGVKAAMQTTDLGLLNPWLRNIRDVYRLHKAELNQIEDEDKRYDRLVELNVQEQCINVIKTPSVQQASKTRGLKVHGWVFDIHTGKLIDLKIDFDKVMENIKEIYKLE